MFMIDLLLKLATIPLILLLLPYFIVANNPAEILFRHYSLIVLGAIYTVGELIFLYRYFKRNLLPRFGKPGGLTPVE